MGERIMNKEYWTHDELQKLDVNGVKIRLNVLPKYKEEVIKRA